MTHLLAQHILQDIDGLAGDRYINTFHFSCPDPAGSNAYDGVASVVNRFYSQNGNDTPGGVLAVTAAHALAPGSGTKVYDMSDLPTREPRSFVAHVAYAVPTTETLPAEVATCLSFEAAPVAGVKPQSLKGRVYLGPFNLAMSETVPGGSWSRPALEHRSLFVNNLARMATEALVYDAVFCVFSRVTATLHPVIRCWCDDAWDTQRRRGGPPTSRVTVPVPA